MKNKIIYSFTILLLFVAGCGKDSGKTTATTSNRYVTSNGVCYDTTTGLATVTTNCTSTTYNSSLFSWNGTTCTSLTLGTTVNTAYCKSNPFSLNTSGQCVDSLTSSIVATTYCTTTSTSTTTSGSCVGVYAYSLNGYVQYVQCNGSNCAGYRLYSLATQQIVNCY